MNTHWLRSDKILLSFLAASMVTVGVPAFLVVRQEQGQANGKEQVYLGETGSAGTNAPAPLTGIAPPQAVQSGGGSADLAAPHPAGIPRVDTFPGRPNNPDQAGHPARPGHPEPGESQEPPRARQPAARPATPPSLPSAKPRKTIKPRKSTKINKPDKPSKITRPGKPGKPAMPDKPANNVKPVKPVKPAGPRKPGDAAGLSHPARLDGAPTTHTPSKRGTSGSANTPAGRGNSEAVIEERAEGAGGDEKRGVEQTDRHHADP